MRSFCKGIHAIGVICPSERGLSGISGMSGNSGNFDWGWLLGRVLPRSIRSSISWMRRHSWGHGPCCRSRSERSHRSHIRRRHRRPHSPRERLTESIVPSLGVLSRPRGRRHRVRRWDWWRRRPGCALQRRRIPREVRGDLNSRLPLWTSVWCLRQAGGDRQGGRGWVVRARGLRTWLRGRCVMHAWHWWDERGRVIWRGGIVWIIRRRPWLLCPRWEFPMIRGGEKRWLNHTLGRW